MKWPLWFQSEVADDRKQQPISEALAGELLDWTRFYREHYDAQRVDEWDSNENVVRYNEIGRAIAGRVAADLGSDYRVLLQLQRTGTEPQRWIEVDV
ncbi:hypothetical protein [Luethyella okanaganae]|uniref:Uncharacterized protein n=1 Tax=Luethyella okanaganae TaxID=69372 RepID=A0ABW1VDN6_9MICO